MKTIQVWQITDKNYADTSFSEEGARIWGGRFNSPGNLAVYTSGSLSLALLENLVQTNNKTYFKNMVSFFTDIPTELIDTPAIADLPNDWDPIPHSKSSQKYGDEWINNEMFPVLRIPSVVVSQEFNYVINPKHEEFSRFKISKTGRLSLDPRIINKFSQ